MEVSKDIDKSTLLYRFKEEKILLKEYYQCFRVSELTTIPR